MEQNRRGVALGKSGNCGAGTFITATLCHVGAATQLWSGPPPPHPTPSHTEHTLYRPATYTWSLARMECDSGSSKFIHSYISASMLRKPVFTPGLTITHRDRRLAVCPGPWTFHTHANTTWQPIVLIQ